MPKLLLGLEQQIQNSTEILIGIILYLMVQLQDVIIPNVTNDPIINGDNIIIYGSLT